MIDGKAIKKRVQGRICASRLALSRCQGQEKSLASRRPPHGRRRTAHDRQASASGHPPLKAREGQRASPFSKKTHPPPYTVHRGGTIQLTHSSGFSFRVVHIRRSPGLVSCCMSPAPGVTIRPVTHQQPLAACLMCGRKLATGPYSDPLPKGMDM
jgi:hypothetical protein